MKHLYLFGLLLSLPFFGFPQGEWNNWIFGQHAGINFNSGSPVPITNVNPIFFTFYSDATVSDSAGNLLFYTENMNVENVYNRNNLLMPNGTLFSGTDQTTQQPFFAVQNLTDDSSYYLFSVIDDYPNFIGLRYSVIDMRLDGGLGDVVPGQKSIPVPGGGTCKSGIDRDPAS